jgi:hypothetical protein
VVDALHGPLRPKPYDRFSVTAEVFSVIRDLAITVCGLIALMSPLVLWTAWSRPMFWLIIVVGCGAILALVLLIRSWPHEKF